MTFRLFRRRPPVQTPTWVKVLAVQMAAAQVRRRIG